MAKKKIARIIPTTKIREYSTNINSIDKMIKLGNIIVINEREELVYRVGSSSIRTIRRDDNEDEIMKHIEVIRYSWYIDEGIVTLVNDESDERRNFRLSDWMPEYDVWDDKLEDAGL